MRGIGCTLLSHQGTCNGLIGRFEGDTPRHRTFWAATLR